MYVYYVYDMRPEGKPDVKLGKDRAAAIARWDEIHNKLPRIRGTLEEAFSRWEEEKLPKYDNAGTRRTYGQNLKELRKTFARSTWDAVKLPHLVKYLEFRKAKTQANREVALLSVIWNQARLWGMTAVPFPAHGMKRAKWKNPEGVRRFKVTTELFELVYSVAEPMLRDCMDLSTATGMRLTDCRTIELPPDNVLRLDASKTGKEADFDLALSEVLPELLKRRRRLREASDGLDHARLLTMPDGSEVTEAKLRGAYDRARDRAYVIASIWNDDALARGVRSMWLRDMRKRASDLAADDEAASKLLQHSSVALTRKHYRTDPPKLRPVR